MEMINNDIEPQESAGLDQSEVQESQGAEGQDQEETQDQETQGQIDHEPPVDHPRFKEIYGKMKHFERELADRDQREHQWKEDLKELQAHNKALMEAVTGVEDKIDAATPRPDPYEDPEGYDNWILERAKKEIRKDQGKTEKPLRDDTKAAPRQTQSTDPRELELSGMHDDYYQVIASVNKEISTDPELNARIWAADNPYDAAYRYGKAKKERMEKKRTDTAAQGFVEGGGNPPANPKTLSASQKRVAAALGVSEKDYIKQLEAIEKGRK